MIDICLITQACLFCSPSNKSDVLSSSSKNSTDSVCSWRALGDSLKIIELQCYPSCKASYYSMEKSCTTWGVLKSLPTYTNIFKIAKPMGLPFVSRIFCLSNQTKSHSFYGCLPGLACSRCDWKEFPCEKHPVSVFPEDQ